MKGLLIHGCYDQMTLGLLKELGVNEFSFDLRGRSPNLIPFKSLNSILEHLSTERVFLTFENDRKETILSFLDLLGKSSFNFLLIFRDAQTASYYEELNHQFYWMFHPEADWQNILNVKSIQGVFLPLKYQSDYQMLPEMWKVIEERELDVYLHAETFEEVRFVRSLKEVKLCIDLSSEVEDGFRKVNHDKLRSMSVWRRLNESFAGQ